MGGALGALFGGFVSDKLRKHRGQKSRVWVLILSQVGPLSMSGISGGGTPIYD